MVEVPGAGIGCRTLFRRGSFFVHNLKPELCMGFQHSRTPLLLYQYAESMIVRPNPDKPEIIATKPPRHKEKIFIIIKLGALVSWWQKYFVR